MADWRNICPTFNRPALVGRFGRAIIEHYSHSTFHWRVAGVHWNVEAKSQILRGRVGLGRHPLRPCGSDRCVWMGLVLGILSCSNLFGVHVSQRQKKSFAVPSHSVEPQGSGIRKIANCPIFQRSPICHVVFGHRWTRVRRACRNAAISSTRYCGLDVY